MCIGFHVYFKRLMFIVCISIRNNIFITFSASLHFSLLLYFHWLTDVCISVQELYHNHHIQYISIWYFCFAFGDGVNFLYLLSIDSVNNKWGDECNMRRFIQDGLIWFWSIKKKKSRKQFYWNVIGIFPGTIY